MTHQYIGGDAFRSLCGKVYDNDGWHIQPTGAPDAVFVATHLLTEWWERQRPSSPFVLITHDSDYAILPSAHRQLADNPLLVRWYAQNLQYDHPKLRPIPIGLANARWPQGDKSVFSSAASKPMVKRKLVTAHYNVAGNTQRKQCCAITGVPPEVLPLPAYCESLAASYFTLSPPGFGADCHRTWEALYLGCIPVLLGSSWGPDALFSDLPVLRLNRWEEWKTLNPDESLYRALWNGFDKQRLEFGQYAKTLNLRV